ncbi:recombinase family protein [Pseudomonas aeruginosa]|uniref:recombinase family protein n=1 Tax=Pseudomonas aeruginosa TaxID=287 RepID=UPI001FF37E41|nr:recombinase family protein [Pseudomonas aeruginosa]MCX5487039.1 recombinase family protein [Pseudomonas aeruginosa]MCX5492799.1 recombinase family protein [Pseudomonas aeruginosa]HCW0557115.1 recombinase family protein [Pseudomonas aeruginosa]HCW0560445.1 recombinase family protein [Pseudomonas aeruginosa]HCW0949293.1 recombinase family protein [Pseudomonas aeruginosa]
MNAHLYLRASTKDQDANRAKVALELFAVEKGLSIVGVYAENISGTKLERPQLLTLLDSAECGEVLLVESVDRLSRLSQADWDTLKATIKAKGLRLVVADLPTSHMLVEAKGITGQIMDVINNMLIDLMATMARLDQEKRVERIKQGLENKRVADPNWKPAGKGKNTAKWAAVQSLMQKHPTMSADQIAKLADCGVATVYRIKREMKAA